MNSEQHPAGRGTSFWHFLATFPTRLSAAIGASFLGRFFGGYDWWKEKLAESRLANRYRETVMRRMVPLRMRGARTFSRSPVVLGLSQIAGVLRSTATRTYGLLFGTFGIYTVLIFLVKHFITVMNADYGELATGVAVGLAGLLLLFSPAPLGTALQDSRLFGTLLYRVGGLQRRPHIPGQYPAISPAVAFLLGSVLGLLAFLVHPLHLLLLLFGTVAFFLLLSSPELCLYTALFLSPFFFVFEHPSVLLCVIVLIGVVSYAGKVLLGKRLFAFEPLDLLLLGLVVLYLSAVFFSYGGRMSVLSALLCTALLGGYFLAANLLSTVQMLRRAVAALVAGAVLVSAIGLFQQFTGRAVAAWLDAHAAAYIGGRITGVFDNPNILASYLILLFPFAMAELLRRGGFWQRVFSFLVFALFTAAIVYTWSRGAWLGVIFSLFAFLLACHPGTIYLLLPILGGLPFLLRANASPIAARLSSAASLSDSSVVYRLNLYRGVLRMAGEHIIGGIGVGEEAFAAVYPYYALSGVESAPHAHSFLLSRLAEFGLMGPLVFLAVLLLFYMCILTHQRREGEEELRLYSIAAGSGVLAVLIYGLFDDPFYNKCVFFLFFAVMGFAVATARVGRTEEERRAPLGDNAGAAFDADIPFCG